MRHGGATECGARCRAPRDARSKAFAAPPMWRKDHVFRLKMEGIVGLGSFWCCLVSSTVELDCDLLPTGKFQSARCQGKHLHF